MKWFPNRILERLRIQAIQATNANAAAARASDAESLEKQAAIVIALRDSIAATRPSLGSHTVDYLLDHAVPPIESKSHLARRKELPSKHIAAVLRNIEHEIARIVSFQRWLIGLVAGIPAALVAVLVLRRTLTPPSSGPESAGEKSSAIPLASRTAAPTPLPTATVPPPSPTATATSTPTATVAPTATATATATTTATPIATERPRSVLRKSAAVSPTPAPKPMPQRSAPPAVAEEAQPKSSPPVNLGGFQAAVQSVNRTQRGFSLSLTFTNVTSTSIMIFAGPSYYDSFYQNFPNAQILKGGGSDDRGQQYFLESMQGFTRAKDIYFSGNNFYMPLGPRESSSATFIFEFSNMYNGSDPATFVSVNVELAVLHDPQRRGSHRTRSLALTRQRLE